MYAPVPGASSGRTRVSVREDIVCIVHVACEEVGGGIVGDVLDWPPPGEGEYLGFVNANRLFGFSFALRMATLPSSSVICY